MVIPQVLDENQLLFFDFKSIPQRLQQWRPLIAKNAMQIGYSSIFKYKIGVYGYF